MTTPSIPSIPDGFCQCGCGKCTSIAKLNNLHLGHIKGRPVRFFLGHRPNCFRVDFSDAAPFKIDGVYCKLIPLTRGLYAIVDAVDYEWINKHKWLAWPTNPKGHWYAARAYRGSNGKQEVIWMHREILGLSEDDDREGDHIETGHTIDNRRKNLRIATGQQNQHNRRMYRCNKTGFKGVIKSSRCSTFIARIRVDGTLIRLGTRPTAERAWKDLYVPAAEKYHKEFARSE